MGTKLKKWGVECNLWTWKLIKILIKIQGQKDNFFHKINQGGLTKVKFQEGTAEDYAIFRKNRQKFKPKDNKGNKPKYFINLE